MNRNETKEMCILLVKSRKYCSCTVTLIYISCAIQFGISSCFCFQNLWRLNLKYLSIISSVLISSECEYNWIPLTKLLMNARLNVTHPTPSTGGQTHCWAALEEQRGLEQHKNKDAHEIPEEIINVGTGIMRCHVISFFIRICVIKTPSHLHIAAV